MRSVMRAMAAMAVLTLAGCGLGAKAPAAPAAETAPAAHSAGEGARLALVIGVGKYRGEISPLDNPARDTDLVTGALRARGFTVTPMKDPDRRGMITALAQFAGELEAAGPDAVGLIYFAGHGAQVNGVNYLLPRDAAMPEGISPDTPTAVLEDILAESFVPAQRLLKALGDREDGVSILVLDACRDNPVTRSLSRRTRSALGAARGLAEMPLQTGVLIAYATGPGDVSYDGASQNSPYAVAFAEELARPGSAADVFTQVRQRVREATDNKQKPIMTYGLDRQFCFNGCGAGAAPAATESGADNAGAGALTRGVSTLAGKWDYPDNACAAPFTYAIAGDDLTITGPNWRSAAKIGQDRDGWLNVTATAPAEVAGKSFGYRVDGATLLIRDGTGAAPTQLSKCP